jgi:D-threo-aldose 1-dehydrogenase
MGDVAALTRFVDETNLDCILLAGRYTLLDQSASSKLLPLCAARGVAVVAGGVFNSGVLADPKPDARYEYEAAPPELVERSQAIAAVCEAHGASLQAAALQFPLRHPTVRSVLTGVRSTGELTQNIRDFDAELPPALWEELATSGLVPSEPALAA